ncbi:hypothetical protein C8A01DRAFT_46843 [Parachaetomium inaequale]|uniref:Polymerase nucleotidyl transferase domain-containing protein n=1 Tax=Parachaetomium inaequale TaxID=2588326 RepID=A0AAN6SQV5_9PEZI|nr:hypothetical protein C8A01DRAFT_46843 [Parachaetomium inaequale]
MHPHHTTTLQNTLAHFSPNPAVLALLLAGSLAHGFATATSDVDVLVVLTEEAYAEQLRSGERTFVSTALATYPGGFVDAKYISLGFMREVAERGSEPARFAFEGARVVLDRIPPEEGVLGGVLERIVGYPVEGKRERVVRFRAQLDAWRWYCGEGLRKREGDGGYLLGLAVRKLVLFGGRLVLAENEVLYPFHKWFLRVLEGVERKPEGLMECVRRVLGEPSEENVEAFYELIKGWREWEESSNRWGPQFMVDTELTWMSGHTPVDDL